MSVTETLALLGIGLGLFVAGHQLYFWCQRNPLFPATRLWFAVDRRIPYRPEWVWVYTPLYYLVIASVAWVVDSWETFVTVAGSYALLLAMQAAFFLLFPVATPREWRSFNRRRTRSEKLLAAVQDLDMRSNSFPSMHVSVAMLSALHLLPAAGHAALLFPLLVATSCVLTKQHYLVDLPAGAGLGYAAHLFTQALVAI
ncbi:MAG: phosphatase PAP2 family protein [Burkholderiales bacterium]